MQIAYVDGPRFRRSVLAACAWAERQRGELNRINVFPVPDGDTGTNLALTLRSVADRLRGSEDDEISAVAREAAQAAVLGARGNCGMMLSHFLLGFAEDVGDRARITTIEFADALCAGVENLHRALQEPVEGTILTVMRDTAEAASSAEIPDFAPLLDHLGERARESLERTPELLPVLRKAGVVDAGAKGFVHLIEGVVRYIEGAPLVAADPRARFDDREPAVTEIEYPDRAERFRFCTEALVRGPDLPDQATVRDRLGGAGDSLIVVRTEDVLKVHVHTDEPEEVFSRLRGLGELVTHKAEDMRAQHAALERGREAARRSGHVRLARRPVAVLTDSAHDLPDEVVRAHGIQVVPLLLVRDDAVLRDGVDVTSDEFARMLETEERLPTTSQPPPGAFLEGYRRAAEDGESVVAVLLSGALSGTFRSAETAAGEFADVPIHLVDSRGASLLQGLLTLRAAELAEAGVEPAEVAGRLARIRDRSGILFTVDTFDRLLASGRVGKGKAWLGSMLGVKPILGLTREGRVEPVGRALGRRRLLDAVMEALDERLPGDGGALRFGVVHVGAPEVVDEVRARLRDRYGPVEVLSGPATAVIATHLGTGAWGLAWLADEPEPSGGPES